MGTKTLRQHQLFWIYVRNQGKCAACGEDLGPDDAVVTNTVLSPSAKLAELEHARLVHSRCRVNPRLN